MTTTAFKKLHVALFAGATALFAAAPAAEAAVVYTNLTAAPIAIPNTIDGIYLNVVTGAYGVSAVPGWDISPYNNNAGLTFYGAQAPSGILASGTAGTSAVAQALSAGALIGAASTGFYNQFQTTGTGTVFQTGGTAYLGFRFLNETTNATNYAWMLISASAGSAGSLGFPASILGYAYENTGASILAGQVSAVPEAGTLAMLALGLAAIGGVAARRRQRG